MPAPRVAYLDLDGTVTRDGSLFHGEDGVTLDAARALARLIDAGVELVPASGRNVRQLRETARILGARTFIAELGSAVAYDGGKRVVQSLPGAPDAKGLRAEIGEALLDAFPSLEWHTPWSEMRDFTLLLRGRGVDAGKVREWLKGKDTSVPLACIDNGEIAEDGTHAFHVLPQGVDKAAGIAADRRERGLDRDACVSFGDSWGDVEMAREVTRHYWVGGTRFAKGDDVPGNVTLTRRAYGNGLLEAVDALLGPA